MNNPEDFAHSYDKLPLRCPECVRVNKVIRHCKVFDNLAALNWHLKREHGIFSNSKFTSKDIFEILKKIAKAKYLGMLN